MCPSVRFGFFDLVNIDATLRSLLNDDHNGEYADLLMMMMMTMMIKIMMAIMIMMMMMMMMIEWIMLHLRVASS